MKKLSMLVMLFMFVPSLSWSDHYVLVMSKEDVVCRHMLNIYNQDLNKYGEIKYAMHKEFNKITWESRRYVWMVNFAKDAGTLSLARFDINNDGKDEIILKLSDRGLKSTPSDFFFIFANKDLDTSKNEIIITDDLVSKAIGVWGGAFNKTPFAANIYPLKELPYPYVLTNPADKKDVEAHYSLGGWFYFHPFIYEGKYYTSMHDRNPSTDNKWEVILRSSPDNQLKDMCYFLKVCKCKDEK